jgi:hypothetical protein
MGIGFPEVGPSGMVTDVTIISERGRLQEEAGMVQGVMARPDKRRVVALIRSCNQTVIIGSRRLYRESPSVGAVREPPLQGIS